MDNMYHIQESEKERLDFTIERCQELPELAEDDAGGAGWRNDGDGGFDGGSKYGPSYFNNNGYGQS